MLQLPQPQRGRNLIAHCSALGYKPRQPTAGNAPVCIRASLSAVDELDVVHKMKTERDTSFRYFPWDIAFASGIPLVLPFLLLAVLQSVPSRGIFILVILISCVAFAGGGVMSWAKLPLYRQGRFLPLGHTGLDERGIRFYRIGLRLAILGLIAQSVFVLVLWMPG